MATLMVERPPAAAAPTTVSRYPAHLGEAVWRVPGDLDDLVVIAAERYVAVVRRHFLVVEPCMGCGVEEQRWTVALLDVVDGERTDLELCHDCYRHVGTSAWQHLLPSAAAHLVAQVREQVGTVMSLASCLPTPALQVLHGEAVWEPDENDWAREECQLDIQRHMAADIVETDWARYAEDR